MLTTDHEIENELILRYKKRARECFNQPSPYYKKGQFPTEYQEIKQWISKLEKQLKQ